MPGGGSCDANNIDGGIGKSGMSVCARGRIILFSPSNCVYRAPICEVVPGAPVMGMYVDAPWISVSIFDDVRYVSIFDDDRRSGGGGRQGDEALSCDVAVPCCKRCLVDSLLVMKIWLPSLAGLANATRITVAPNDAPLMTCITTHLKQR